MTEEELMVVKILGNLSSIVLERERIRFRWGGATRKRALRHRKSISSEPPSPKKHRKKRKVSPDTPLQCRSSDEESGQEPDTVAPTPPLPRPSKKLKFGNKEWRANQNTLVLGLQETNLNLQQEAAKLQKHYETLSLKNARLKEGKSKSKSKWEKKTAEEEKEGGHAEGPTSTHLEEPKPTTSIERGGCSGVGVGVGPSPARGGKAGAPTTGGFDLNVALNENGYAIEDPEPDPVPIQPLGKPFVEARTQSWPLDMKKIAASKARRRRMETMNRRKNVAVADVALERILTGS